ncbi:MAG: DNA polymerase III subunit alpha [Alphaproteobacteria bacterium]
MAHADFVHLRVHSAYSLSEGALKIDEIAALCRANAMPAVALADTGNLFGGLEFSAAAATAGIQPIIGAQVFVARIASDSPTAYKGDRLAREGRAPDPDSIVLLCQNETGYRNLVRLVSKAYLETPAGETPRASLADLDHFNEGLICLTGGPAGPVGRLLAEGRDDLAEDALKALARSFAGRCYVEIHRHGQDIERRIEPRLVSLADGLHLPLVAVNECFFATADLYEAHDALLCIAGGTTMSQTERRRVTAEHRFKNAAEMRALFADLPDAADNTLVIARRCAFMVKSRDPILPAFPVPADQDEASWLGHKAKDGLDRRLGQVGTIPADLSDDERDRRVRSYRERLDYELDVIVRMGFAGYFLIVADFIQWAKAQSIPVGPGRGSGAGSVVAWALTITDLDPLRFGLLFERFLNPERVSMPDFDIDFCQDRRDEVIRYVQNRYGHDRVAQIITFGKLQARAVLRDVGRVLELPYGQVDRICKLVPNNPANPVTLAQAIDNEPLLQAARDEDPAVARMIGIALKLEGLYRHASTHAAGLVIGDRPLAELVPLYRDPRSGHAGHPVSSMKYVEKAADW